MLSGLEGGVEGGVGCEKRRAEDCKASRVGPLFGGGENIFLFFHSEVGKLMVFSRCCGVEFGSWNLFPYVASWISGDVP